MADQRASGVFIWESFQLQTPRQSAAQGDKFSWTRVEVKQKRGRRRDAGAARDGGAPTRPRERREKNRRRGNRRAGISVREMQGLVVGANGVAPTPHGCHASPARPAFCRIWEIFFGRCRFAGPPN